MCDLRAGGAQPERIGDVVIFANAKKLTYSLLAVIEKHPAVTTALICGTGRARPAVLLRPRLWPKNNEDEKRLLELMWSSFERAKRQDLSTEV